jgi:serine/threonine protein kinase
MIICVYGLHSEANLYHGHIRTSNFLLQTNDHVVLTDFASYKPLYMLEDDLGEFRLYYGSSGSKCCLAPEKLIPQSERERVNRSPIELLKGHRKDKTTRDVQAPSYISRISMKADSTFMSGSAYRSLQVNLTEVISSSEYTTQSELVSKISDYSGEIFKLKQMDIFSLGCTMLDVLLNGKFAMTHEDLLKLKRGEFSLQPLIMQAT